MNAKANPVYFGKILIAFIAAGYIPSAYMFYKGGKYYVEMINQNKNKNDDEQISGAPNAALA